MKKAISLFLVFVLISSIIPMSTMAAESKHDVSDVVDEMVTKACVVFPEYAYKMNGSPNNSRAYVDGTNPPTIVVSTTRDVSENESMTYTEYSDGTILLSSEQYNCTTNISVDQSLPTSISYNMTITATCISNTGIACDGYFRLNNLKYTVVFNGYDSITSIGSAQYQGNCDSRNGKYRVTMHESSAGAASLRYYLQFSFPPGDANFYASTVVFTLRNDTYSARHVGGTQ